MSDSEANPLSDKDAYRSPLAVGGLKSCGRGVLAFENMCCYPTLAQDSPRLIYMQPLDARMNVKLETSQKADFLLITHGNNGL